MGEEGGQDEGLASFFKERGGHTVHISLWEGETEGILVLFVVGSNWVVCLFLCEKGGGKTSLFGSLFVEGGSDFFVERE